MTPLLDSTEWQTGHKMKRRFYAVMLVLMMVRALLPFVFGQALRLPHAHVIIGNVTPEELREHEQWHSQPTDDSKQSIITGGIIVSLPFGDWQGLLLDLFLIALASPFLLACPPLTTRPGLIESRPLNIFHSVAEPPPRAI